MLSILLTWASKTDACWRMPAQPAGIPCRMPEGCLQAFRHSGIQAFRVLGRCPRVYPEVGGCVGKRRAGRQASAKFFCRNECSTAGCRRCPRVYPEVGAWVGKTHELSVSVAFLWEEQIFSSTRELSVLCSRLCFVAPRRVGSRNGERPSSKFFSRHACSECALQCCRGDGS